MTMGQRIARRRRQLGLSQEALADAVGVSRQAVSKWELDEAQPDAAKIVLLAQALGMTTDELLLGAVEEGAEEKPAPRPDRLGRLEALVRKHGYKVGYVLIAWGLVLVLVSVLFMGAVSSIAAPPSGAQTSGLQWEDGERPSWMTPEEEKRLEQQIERQLYGPSAAGSTVLAIAYLILLVPLGFGGVMIYLGAVILHRYKPKDE